MLFENQVISYLAIHSNRNFNKVYSNFCMLLQLSLFVATVVKQLAMACHSPALFLDVCSDTGTWNKCSLFTMLEVRLNKLEARFSSYMFFFFPLVQLPTQTPIEAMPAPWPIKL